MNRKYDSLNIKVEHPAGSIRTGTNDQGIAWKRKMFNDYGYIYRTKGHDGEQIDCYLGGHPSASHVYVIHQHNHTTNQYDEDKCMLGFRSEAAAKLAFLMHAPHPSALGGVTAIPFPEFQAMIKDTGKTRLTWKDRAHLGEVTHESFASVDEYNPQSDFWWDYFSTADALLPNIMKVYAGRMGDALAFIKEMQSRYDTRQLRVGEYDKLGGPNAGKTLSELHKAVLAEYNKVPEKPVVSPEVVRENQENSLLESASKERSKRIKSLVDEIQSHRETARQNPGGEWGDRANQEKAERLRELNQELDRLRKERAEESKPAQAKIKQIIGDTAKTKLAIGPSHSKRISDAVRHGGDLKTDLRLDLIRAAEIKADVKADPGYNKQKLDKTMSALGKRLKLKLSEYAQHVAATTDSAINSRAVMSEVRPFVKEAENVLENHYTLAIDFDRLARKAGRSAIKIPTAKSAEQNRIHPHAPVGGKGKFLGGQFIPVSLRNAKLAPRTDLPEKHGIVDAKGNPKSKKEMTPKELAKAFKVTQRNKQRIMPLVNKHVAIYNKAEKLSEKVMKDQPKLWGLAVAKKAVNDKNESGITYAFEVPDMSKLDKSFTDPRAGKFTQLDWKNPPKHFVDWVVNGDTDFLNAKWGGFYVPENPDSNYAFYAFDRQTGKFKPSALAHIKARNAEGKWKCVRSLDPHFQSIINHYATQAVNHGSESDALMWFIASTGLRADSGKMLPGRYGASSLLNQHVKKKGGDIVIEFMGKGTNKKSGAVLNNRTITKDPYYDLDTIIADGKKAKTKAAKAKAWLRAVEACDGNVVYDPDLVDFMMPRIGKGKPTDPFWNASYAHAADAAKYAANKHGITYTGRDEKYEEGSSNPSPHRYRNYMGRYMGEKMCEIYSVIHGTPSSPDEYLHMLEGNINPGKDVAKTKQYADPTDPKKKKFAGILAFAGKFLNDQRTSYYNAYFDPMIAEKYKKKAGVTWPDVFPSNTTLKKDQALKKTQLKLRKIMKKLSPLAWAMK